MVLSKIQRFPTKIDLTHKSCLTDLAIKRRSAGAGASQTSERSFFRIPVVTQQ